MIKFLVLIVLLLSGCATYQGAKSDLTAAIAKDEPGPEQTAGLAARLTADLNQAIERASQATDLMAPQRAICYQTILKYVPNLPTLVIPRHGDTAGIFDRFEVAAELAENTAGLVEFQIPPETRVEFLVACGPIAQAARDLLLKFNLRAVRAAGALAILPK